MTLNVVHLVGRAGRDPEVKYFESGKVKCSLSLAVDRRGKNSDEPDWFELEIWDKTAEVAANYVKKGRLLGIKGSLKLDTWVDKNSGANRSRPLIRVSQLDLLGSKRDSEGNSGNPGDREF